MSNLYIAAGILAALITSHFYAYEKGVAARKAEETEIALSISKAREEAAKGAAEAIAKIEIVNKTIYNKVQHEITKEPVYIECQHSPDGLRLVNDALTAPNLP